MQLLLISQALSLWICSGLLLSMGTCNVVLPCIWLVLFGVMVSRFWNVVAYVSVRHPFLWLNTILWYEYTSFCLSIYQIAGLLGFSPGFLFPLAGYFE